MISCYLYALRHIESPFFQARLQQFDYFNTNAKANLDFAHDLGYAEKYAATYYFYLSQQVELVKPVLLYKMTS